jgi:hypothetical protein
VSPVGSGSTRNKKPLFPEKLKLKAAGLWTTLLEEKWDMMEAEEGE